MREQQQKIRMQEAIKGSGKIGSSYDVNGKAVSLQRIKVFPELISKCGNVVVHNDPRSATLQENPAVIISKHSRDSHKPKFDENASPKENTRPRDLAPIPFVTGVYESIVPAVGVTFYETGKNPKMSNASLSKQMGRMSKTELQTMQYESTLYQSKFLQSQKQEQKEVVLPEVVPKEASEYFQLVNVSNSGQQKLSFRKQKLSAATAPTKFEISGDMSQLLVRKDDSAFYKAKLSQPTSVVPKPYVPPMFRSQKTYSFGTLPATEQILHKTMTDLFNMDVLNNKSNESTFSPQRLSFKPITKASSHQFAFGNLLHGVM